MCWFSLYQIKRNNIFLCVCVSILPSSVLQHISMAWEIVTNQYSQVLENMGEKFTINKVHNWCWSESVGKHIFLESTWKPQKMKLKKKWILVKKLVMKANCMHNMNFDWKITINLVEGFFLLEIKTLLNADLLDENFTFFHSFKFLANTRL